MTQNNYGQIAQKAMRWIDRHQVTGEGIMVGSKTRISYPEVTGYYIPTLLEIGRGDIAEKFAAFLVRTQQKDGSWLDPAGKAPYVFDSAQILKGLLAIEPLMYEVHDSILQGCDWLLTNMKENGRLTTPSKDAWGNGCACSELIHLYCLQPLYLAAERYDRRDYRQAADKIRTYYVTEKKPEILHFGLLSHFYAYVMEALVDIGETELATAAMNGLHRLQRPEGWVPAYEKVGWVCSPGLFQLALVWYKLGEVEPADAAFSYACSLQNVSGGWFGSYPVEHPCRIWSHTWRPNYFARNEISWTVKYFFDAYHAYQKAHGQQNAEEMFK